MNERLLGPGFASVSEARAWMASFTTWYNHEHRHSGIGLHTPPASTTAPPPSSAPAARPSSAPPTTPTPKGSAAGFLRPTLERLGRFEICFGIGLPEEITVHLDSGTTRDLLAELGCKGVISQKGFPLQAGARWVVERTNS